MLWVPHPFAAFAKGWDRECQHQTRQSAGGATDRSPGRDRGPRRARFWLVGVGEALGRRKQKNLLLAAAGSGAVKRSAHKNSQNDVVGWQSLRKIKHFAPETRR